MCNAVTVSTLLRIFDAHEENHFFFEKTVVIHPSVETYIQTTSKYTTSRWVDLFFPGRVRDYYAEKPEESGAVLKVKNRAGGGGGGFGFSLGTDHGGIVVLWLTPHSRRLLYLQWLCRFGLRWGRLQFSQKSRRPMKI